MEDKAMMRNSRKFFTVALTVSMMALTACGAQKTETAGSSAGTISDSHNVSTSSAAIADPFTEVSGMKEAAAMTGFNLTLPEAPEDYPDQIIRVMNTSMIEVIFANNANETEDKIDEGFRVRKEKTDEDISGDYNEYETVTAVHIGDYDVTEKGNGDTISVATWKSDGYSYAIDAEYHPMTAEEMAAVVQSVQ